MFIAPTEPPRLREIGVTSSIPETYGVDVYWESELGKIGIQRKVFPDDFLSSVFGKDGRLYREFPMMQALDHRVLLLEGREQWTTSGALIRVRNGGRWAWSRTQHRNYLHSVSYLFNVEIAHSDNLADTIEFVSEMRLWSDKRGHPSLIHRPNPAPDSPWGSISNKAWLSHFLQGIDGIGPKVAEAIIDHFGGIPFTLSVSEAELKEVPGVGPKLAKKIAGVFEGVDL
jgi:ERCC4-type nuclease